MRQGLSGIPGVLVSTLFLTQFLWKERDDSVSKACPGMRQGLSGIPGVLVRTLFLT